MSLKRIVSLVTPQGTNEQTGVHTITSTASSNSREYPELGNFQRGIFFLNVASVSGTNPTLTVALQVEDPMIRVWQQVFAFTQQTAATGGTPIAAITQELYGLNYRLAWTIGGTATPTFTFSCACIAGAEIPWN